MSKAIELADRITPETDWYEFHAEPWCESAAAELRRLAEVEKEYERLKASKEVQCQYAKDVGMTDYRCSGKCQYESLARAVMSDNTGKA